ncbi:MAG TPA: radical SAM/Cys-rich domain protein [Gammaproteobacteria bacterium]|nr:radical SAM/Cys-rich domain protein [Gammaproteobacteria bacterium]
MLDTLEKLLPSDFPALSRQKLETLQVNLGYQCNQQCLHCHVNAGPNRKEVMSRDTVNSVLSAVKKLKVKTLDLTGGAPELNPHFRYLVQQARDLSVHVMDRCNLTILTEPDQENLARFLAINNVEMIASLPCYTEDNVDSQRGKGVYQKSLQGLKILNDLGYGQAGSSLQLNLVYNPGGAFLPPSQQDLERDYKEKLFNEHGIVFNALYTITNMPIKRFGSTLLSKGTFDEYMSLLKSAYQKTNLTTVMCRSMVSVDWQGYLYDCDFNQMLNLPITDTQNRKLKLERLDVDTLDSLKIYIADHCYGCTAGQGSSCGGALLD